MSGKGGKNNKSKSFWRYINPTLPRNKKYVNIVCYGAASCFSLGMALSVGVSPAFAME